MNNNIKVLSDVEHVLLRPNQYIGSTKKRVISTFIYDPQLDKFEYKDIIYIPAIIKIICEILDNSVDEAIKTKFKYSNKIDITMTDTTIKISDNGRGIPVIKEEKTKKYMPLLAWTQLRAGSNFSDDNRITRGMNGVGSSCTNIFSKYFEANTCDGKKAFKLTCKDNMSSIKESIRSSSKNGTSVIFEPDLTRFGIESIDENHINLIKQIIINQSVIYPKIKFTFNGVKISYFNSFKTYMSKFSDNFTYISGEKYDVGIFENESDDIRFITFVNGLFMLSGGTHINYVSKRVCEGIRELINSKNKDMNIKPSDIKNKFSYVIFLYDFPNPEHNSQTKDSLENEEKDISNFIHVDFNQFCNTIYKNKALIEPILLYGRVKNEMKQIKEIEDKEKKNKKTLFSPKYIPANSKDRTKCSLYICEGDSASSPFLSCRESTKYQGLFPIRGKILNVREVDMMKIYKNAELNEILKICGLSLLKMAVNFDWGKQFYKVKYPDLPQIIVNEKDKIRIGDEWVLVKNIDEEYLFKYDLQGKEFSIDKNLIKRRIINIDMNFGNGIKLLVDADHDGNSILGLFINFFSKYFPEMFEAGLVKRIKSPVVIGVKGKEKVRYYTLDDYYKNRDESYQYKYYKGLGGLSKDEYKLILNDEKNCEIFDFSTIRDYNTVDMVYAKDKSDERKKWLMGEL